MKAIKGSEKERIKKIQFKVAWRNENLLQKSHQNIEVRKVFKGLVDGYGAFSGDGILFFEDLFRGVVDYFDVYSCLLGIYWDWCLIEVFI